MDIRFLRYEFRDGGGTLDAARKLQVHPRTVVKTLVFTDYRFQPPRYAAVLMPGDRRVSVRRLEKLGGMALVKPASPMEVQQASGCRVGGVSPFALAGRMPIFGQQDIRLEDRVMVNAGERGLVVDLPAAGLDILRISWGDLASPRPRLDKISIR